MAQPIPKNIISKHPEMAVKGFDTLLVDGSNLLELCFSVSKRLSSNGREVGAIYAFINHLKGLMKKRPFRYVYCFFDGPSSGQMRHDLNMQYKENREDKFYEDDSLSDYMKEVNRTLSRWAEKGKQKQKNSTKTETEKENYHWQQEVLMACLDELFIRVVMCDKTEADDFIGYYVSHKKPEENIIIYSNDRDLTQLISDKVAVYIQSFKSYVHINNHTEKMGYHYENVVLKKVLCGDTSDNIKGIKGLGEITLFNNFPQIKERKVSLNEIIDGARQINEERASQKKKPLKWAENIVNRITDGCQGDKIYEINEKIINLKNPLMPDEAKELIEMFMYAPLDPTDRSQSNLYNILIDNGLDDFRNENVFSGTFNDFQYYINREMQESKK